jgi:hypothetical protein
MNFENPDTNNESNEPLLEELESINNELIANNASNTLSNEALEAKLERKREIEATLEEQD